MTTPITQFSKILHRRGLLADLPTLNTSELGHAIDDRRLFIGNGEPAEGAPIIGNTEIITDVTLLSNHSALKHVYRGNIIDAGIPVVPITGIDAQHDTIRGIAQVLDDRVSVKDFGAIGDGIVDDTAAINRALKEIFTIVPTNTAVETAYRTLYFPAGVYKVSNFILLPPNAIIVGDGIGRTIIYMTNPAKNSVIRLVDNDFQTVDVTLSLPPLLTTIYPKNIQGYGITFKHCALDKDILNLELFSASSDDTNKNIYFENCRFEGIRVSETTVDAAVYIQNLGLSPVDNIRFVNCQVANTAHIIYSDINSNNIRRVYFDNCDFSTLNFGIHLSTVSAFSDVKVRNSYFDNITSQAVHVGGAMHENVLSRGNTFRRCGLDTGPTIQFVTDAVQCSSIDDRFIDCGGMDIDNAGINTIIMNNTGYLVFQNFTITPLMPTYTLNAGVPIGSPGATGYQFNTDQFDTAFIDYTLHCFTTVVRIGRLYISVDTLGNAIISDQFSETAPSGVIFDVNISGTTLQLVYTSATNASLSYTSTLNLQSKLWSSVHVGGGGVGGGVGGGGGGGGGGTFVDLEGAVTSIGNVTSLGIFSSSNLHTALSTKTGTGLAVFNDSPSLSGVPTAPTASVATSTIQVATTEFVQQAIPVVIDFPMFIPYAPDGNAVMNRIIMARPVSVVVNFVGSYASCITAPTATTIISLKKNGSVVGTVTFLAGNTTGTFVAASSVTLSAGDILEVVNQPISDISFANVSINLTGTKV